MFNLPLHNDITANRKYFQDFLEVFFDLFFLLCDLFFTFFQGKTLSIALPLPFIPRGSVYPEIDPPPIELNSSMCSAEQSSSISRGSLSLSTFF